MLKNNAKYSLRLHEEEIVSLPTFITVSAALALSAPPASAQSRAPADTTPITRFDAIPVPTPDRQIALYSEAVNNLTRLMIYFRSPCNGPNDYDYSGQQVYAWKSAGVAYSHTSFCSDGSIESWSSIAADPTTILAEQLRANSAGTMRSLEGQTFRIPSVAIHQRYRIEYFDLNELEESWFARRASVPARPAVRNAGGAAVPSNLIGTSVYCSVHTYSQELFGGATRPRDQQPDQFRLLFTGANEVTIRGSDNHSNRIYTVHREGRKLVLELGMGLRPNMLGHSGWEVAPTLDLDSFDWSGTWFTLIMGVKGMKYEQGSCE